jgi:hypothetical protein
MRCEEPLFCVLLTHSSEIEEEDTTNLTNGEKRIKSYGLFVIGKEEEWSVGRFLRSAGFNRDFIYSFIFILDQCPR